ncbi:MAG TPA: class I SAM-dependent methyltransferase [Desulfovibrio sp.]|uniref:class I SAM-dependent methyltransferase n=1 Tax=Desulfovibrio sp. TaxID=885 RepID=UPI002BE6E5A5|nr:class I SAM-dependent methyltransferase [Desulfovibrio sp.]HMM38690.1 class I SAM-dependent methyltransferase [Desulfovibrio sp.]
MKHGHSLARALNRDMHDMSARLEAQRKELGARTLLFRMNNASNSQKYQLFQRQLTDDAAAGIQARWLPNLGLPWDIYSLAYRAHRICLVEDRCLGRLATRIEAALLRALVAESLGHRFSELRILEIGTLFGISVAAIHECCFGTFERIRVTVIDPLNGYYDQPQRDELTKAVVSRRVFEENMRRNGIPQRDVRVIQKLSFDDEAEALAAEERYNLLIIDGDHSRAGVENDWRRFGPLLEPGGCVIFDDYGAKDWPDVQQYVDAQVMNRPDLELVGAEWRTAAFRVRG